MTTTNIFFPSFSSVSSSKSLANGLSKTNPLAGLKKMFDGMGLDRESARKVKANLKRLETSKANIMFAGATGVGKSSTINALFDMDKARVGQGNKPETMDIRQYELADRLTIWDTPGLGDSPEKDKQHAKLIVKKLKETDAQGQYVIDLVVVLLEAGVRDMGTCNSLILDHIIPALGKHTDRLLVVINQADMGLGGKSWDFERNEPQPKLIAFLDEKVKSVQRRIYESTQVTVTPIYFAAGYKDGKAQQLPYNLAQLQLHLLMNLPKEKRLMVKQQETRSVENFVAGDRSGAMRRKTESNVLQSVVDTVADGVSYVADKVSGFVSSAWNKVTSWF